MTSCETAPSRRWTWASKGEGTWTLSIAAAAEAEAEADMASDAWEDRSESKTEKQRDKRVELLASRRAGGGRGKVENRVSRRRRPTSRSSQARRQDGKLLLPRAHSSTIMSLSPSATLERRLPDGQSPDSLKQGSGSLQTVIALMPPPRARFSPLRQSRSVALQLQSPRPTALISPETAAFPRPRLSGDCARGFIVPGRNC